MQYSERIGARRMRRHRILLLAFVFASAAAWPQTENPPAQPPVPPLVGYDNSAAPAESPSNYIEDRMLTPPPVSGATYPVQLGSEERSNYLDAGLSFTTAYSDNVLGGVSDHPVSDISYSVAPTIALNKTTSRLHGVLTYAPGFTFYQRVSDRNESDHNASIDLQYRLSPHVNVRFLDAFQKSSNVFNDPALGSTGTVSGGVQGPSFAVIPPIANRISNFGNVGIAYQFARNQMTGASGSFTNLHYPDQSQVPGLYDSASQSGSAFYSFRVSKVHYLGAVYQYQRLLSYPTAGASETQTHATLLFYSFYPSATFSISLFGGPQHSATIEPPVSPLDPRPAEARAWNPAAGASVSWQGQRNSFAVSYFHVISGGGGLIGAVQADSAMMSFRQQVSRTLTASVDGGYVQSNIVGAAFAGTSNGHTWSGSALLEQQLGRRLSVQFGYTRIHQTYTDIPIISLHPDTNREFISLNYRFSRPLGR